MLGEVRFGRGESENAIMNFSEAIQILKEVGNPRQLWQAYASLASTLGELGRLSEAREQWGAASEVVGNLANGLSDHHRRDGFFGAVQVRKILSKAES